MNFEKIKKLTYLTVFILGITLIAYLFMKHVFLVILPFLIAWFVAFMLRPVAIYISRKTKISVRVIRPILTSFLILASFGIGGLGVWALSREAWALFSGIGSDNSIKDIIGGIIGTGGIISGIFGEFSEYVSDGIYNLIMSLLSKLAGAVSSVASAIPKAMFFILITLISSIYFSIDLEKINGAVRRLLPVKAYELLVRMKDGFLHAFSKYVRSYALLLVITFAEMLVGLFALRAPYPVLISILIALFDLLPVIGVGTVLIPWSVWSILVGKSGFGIGLIVLFVLHTVLRQLIEPRIVGKNLGVHPVLTLILLYAGYSLFGIVGLLLVPVFTVLFNIALNKDDTTEVGKKGSVK